MDTELTFEIQGIIYLIREIFGMRGSESDPHVRIDTWNVVQQIREAKTAQFRPVDGFKAPAELGQLSSTKLLLWRISVAVYILTQQSYLLHPLNQIYQTFHQERWPSHLLELPEVYSELTVGGLSVTYLIREHSDLLQDGAHRSTPLSSSGEGNNTVRAHVVTASHYGPANTKDPKLQVIQGSTDKIPKEKGKIAESKTDLHVCTVSLWSMVNRHDVSVGLF